MSRIEGCGSDQPKEKERPSWNVTAVGIDLSNKVFSAHGVAAHGKIVLKKTVSRSNLLDCHTHLPPWRIDVGI